MSVNTDLSYYIKTIMLFTWWTISSGCYLVLHSHGQNALYIVYFMMQEISIQYEQKLVNVSCHVFWMIIG